MKPVVFLDIDGVLNTSKNYTEWNERHAAERTGVDVWIPDSEDRFILLLFDRVNVGVLNTITDGADAEIVVSSSWRMFYARDFGKLRGVLNAAGVKAPIIGPTPTIVPQRGPAISSWLLAARKGGTRMLILDDDHPAEFGREREFHLHVNHETGLIPGDIEKARRILERTWTP